MHRPRNDTERAPGDGPGEEHGGGVTAIRLPNNRAQGKADQRSTVEDVPTR